MHPIYLDHNATTPLAPEVVEVMTEHLHQVFANPSSPHQLGRQAKALLVRARREVASYLGVRPREVVFTASGTEATNLFIRGYCSDRPPGHMITSSVEHSCVYTTVQAMENAGWTADFVAPGLHGAITAESVEAALRPETSLIAVMAVNNETGVKTDLDALAALAAERGIALFVDGVAWLGKEELHVPRGVTALSFSGHKIHGPKGVGILTLRQKVKLAPHITGGGQEFGLRGGTEDLLSIVGLAQAVQLLRTELPDATRRMQKLRDRLEQGIVEACSHVQVNGSGPRIANTCNLAFDGVDGESLLINLDQEGVAVSHGSACSTGALEPSRILINMGIPLERARSSLRFSLSRYTTEEEIDRAVRIVAEQVHRLRN